MSRGAFVGWILIALALASAAGCEEDDGDAPTGTQQGGSAGAGGNVSGNAGEGGGAGASSGREFRVEDSSQLTAALEEAGPGDLIVLTQGAYVGHFSVSAGVVLEGNGSTVTGDGDTVFVLEGGPETATEIRNLRVDNAGTAITGETGSLVLADVEIHVETGAGLVVRTADYLELTRVTVSGPVTAESVGELEEGVHPEAVAAVGVAAFDTEIAFEDVSVNGFAGYGVLLRNTSGSWSDGSVYENVGTGILAEGSELDFTRVAVRDGLVTTRAGSTAIAFGIVISAKSSVTTGQMTIERIAGPGVLQDNSESTHDGLEVAATDLAGVWLQNARDVGTALSIVGASNIRDSAGVGVYLNSVHGAVFDGLSVTGTTKRVTLMGPTPVEIGDGIQATGVSGALQLLNTTLTDNARAGLVFDGTGADADPELLVENLAIHGTGDYGLIIQNSTLDFAADDIDPTLAERDATARESNEVLTTQPTLSTIPCTSAAIGDDGQLLPADSGAGCPRR